MKSTACAGPTEALLLALEHARVALARPDLFAVEESATGGKTRRDPTTGRTLGAVFFGLGGAALGAGIYDSVRARDRVHRSTTVALVPGPATACDAPTVPAAQRRLELQLGQFHSQVATDLEGRARFLLPGPELWPPEPDEQTEEDGMAAQDVMNAQGVMNATRPPSRRWRGTLQIGLERSVQVEVVLPYDQTALTPNTGPASGWRPDAAGGPATVYIGLGSNLGDRLGTLRAATRLLRDGAVPGTALVCCSPVYETRPLGPATGSYLNAVAELRTVAEPAALLAALLELELRHGRTRRERWASRTLDLDLLVWEGERGMVELAGPELRLPHPELLAALQPGERTIVAQLTELLC